MYCLGLLALFSHLALACVQWYVLTMFVLPMHVMLHPTEDKLSITPILSCKYLALSLQMLDEVWIVVHFFPLVFLSEICIVLQIRWRLAQWCVLDCRES